MAGVDVAHEAGDRFRLRIRGHELVVDQPVQDGGGDAGPTPTELFVAGLASCVGFYAERFLVRHGLPTEGLAVECDFAFAQDRPARVASIDVRLVLPEAFPEAKGPALQAVVEHCTVHNSIVHAPEIRVVLSAEPRVA